MPAPFFCTTLFVGCLSLFLAAAGTLQRSPLKRVFLAVAMAGLWLSTGERGQLLPLLQKVLPILARFRYPEKYLAFFWLGLCGLVCMGVERVFRAPRVGIKILSLAAATALSGAAYIATHGLARQLWSLLGEALPAADPLASVVDAAWAQGLAWAGVFCLLAAAILRLAAQRKLVQTLLPVALFVELWQVNAAHLPVMPASLLSSMPPFASVIHRSAAPHTPLARVRRQDVSFMPIGVTEASAEEQRLWSQSVRNLLVPDASGLYGITSVGMNLGGESARHHRILSTYGKNSNKYGPWFNACFKVTGLASPGSTDPLPLAQDEQTGLQLMSTPCRPRAFLSGTRSVHGLPEAVAALQEMRLADDWVVWEEGPAMAAANGQVVWTHWAPEHIVLDVRADAATALILSDDLAPGWTATLDDRPVKIYTAMVVGSGVVMPAGAHRLEFQYHTPQLRTGAAMSCTGLMAAALLGFFPTWRRRRGLRHPTHPGVGEAGASRLS